MNYTLNFLDLDDIKQQCRIAAEDDDEDGLLTIYGAASERDILELINRSAVEVIDEWGELPAPLYAAMLARVGTRYKYREDVTPDVTNDAGVLRAVNKFVKL